MSELILKTKTGAEFWTDTDDCTAEGNFNVFYFASHDDEQPQAVATDCDSWAAAADQLAGYVKPVDFDDFERELVREKNPIFDFVTVDGGSRDIFDADTDTEYHALTGTAWLSDRYTPEGADECVLVFNLYIPAYGAAYVSFCSPLPESLALAEETAEAALLDAAAHEIDVIRGVIASEHIIEAVDDAIKGLRDAEHCLNAAIDDASALNSYEVGPLNQLRDKVDALSREFARYVKTL